MEFPHCGVCRGAFSPDACSDMVPMSSASCPDSLCRGCVQRHLSTSAGITSSNASVSCPLCGEAEAFSQNKQLINKNLCESLKVIASMQLQQQDDETSGRKHHKQSTNEHDNGSTTFTEPPAKETKATTTSIKGTKGHWDGRVRELKEFQRQHGHCRVPHKYHPNLALGYFVCNIRKLYRAKQAGQPSSLTDSQVTELDALGFTWNVHGPLVSFDDRLERLQEFAAQHGHLRVPAVKILKDPGHVNPWRSLGLFVADMRKEYKLHQEGKSSRLDQSRIQALEALGMEWVARNLTTFAKRLQQLKAFYAQHQHYRVDRGTDPGLKAWVEKIRLEYKRIQEQPLANKQSKLLPPDQLQALLEINFDWTNDNDCAWNNRWEELKAFHQEHGHCRVGSTRKHRQALMNWVGKQREHYRLLQLAPTSKSKSLTPDRIAKLNELGFEWKPMENEETGNTGIPKSFDERLDELRDYYKKHNNYRVSKSAHKGLKWWVDQVRTDYKKWQEDQHGGEHDSALHREQKNGHGSPTPTASSTGGASSTAETQSALAQPSKGMILTTLGRMDALKAINFDWDTDREYEWKEAFRKYLPHLQEYHKEHGHCQLPRSPSDPLFRWTIRLREYAAKCMNKRDTWRTFSLLTPDRVQALDAMGFEWKLSKKRKDTDRSVAAKNDSGQDLDDKEKAASKPAPSSKRTKKQGPVEHSISNPLLLAAASALSLATTTDRQSASAHKRKTEKSQPENKGVSPGCPEPSNRRSARQSEGKSKNTSTTETPPAKKLARDDSSTMATRTFPRRNPKRCSRPRSELQVSRFMLLQVILCIGIFVEAAKASSSSLRDDLHMVTFVSKRIVRPAHPDELVRSQARIWVENSVQDCSDDNESDHDNVDLVVRDATKSTIGVYPTVPEHQHGRVGRPHLHRSLERYRLHSPLEMEEPISSFGSRVDTSMSFSNRKDKSRLSPILTSTGTTIAGVCGIDPTTNESFCVLGADTRATAGRMVADKHCSKIHCLAHNLWCCGAGTSADLDQTTRHCRYALALQVLTEQASLGNARVQMYDAVTTTSANMADDFYLERPAEHCSSMATACRFLRSLLYEQQGSVGANLIVGGIDPGSGLAQIRAIHPHGSMDALPYAALGSGGLAAMAVLESRYSSFEASMNLSSAIELVRDAIVAGIQNDMGSGSQVDLCVMTCAGGERVVTRHLRAHVPEEELPEHHHDGGLKTHRPEPKTTTSTPGVNGFGNLPYSVRSRRLVLPNSRTTERERLTKWDQFLGI